MDQVSYRRILAWCVFALCCASGFKSLAGGSGLNTVVIVNQASSNSCEVGNYFCERRQVPPGKRPPHQLAGLEYLLDHQRFPNRPADPSLLNMLAAGQLTNQIDYIVLSTDIPFQTSLGLAVNSTTSILFYGSRQGENGSNVLGVTNSYAASEAAFPQAAPVGAPGSSFLCAMITADSVADAEQLVDQGVNGNAAYPQQPVVLAKSSDTTRNIRFYTFDNAIFNVNILGVSSILPHQHRLALE